MHAASTLLRRYLDALTEAGATQRYLYHLTGADALRSILERGIDPGYWGELSIIRYYQRMKLHTGEPLVFRVSFDRFRDDKLEPDMRGLQDPPDASVIDMTADELEQAWDASGQTWKDSLALIGSVLYRGVVPVTDQDVLAFDDDIAAMTVAQRRAELVKLAIQFHPDKTRAEIVRQVRRLPAAYLVQLLITYRAKGGAR